MRKFTLTCNCEKVYPDMINSGEFPGWVNKVRCNWCPACEDLAQAPYEEWYEPWNAPEPKPDFVDPNQLNLFEE